MYVVYVTGDYILHRSTQDVHRSTQYRHRSTQVMVSLDSDMYTINDAYIIRWDTAAYRHEHNHLLGYHIWRYANMEIRRAVGPMTCWDPVSSLWVMFRASCLHSGIWPLDKLTSKDRTEQAHEIRLSL